MAASGAGHSSAELAYEMPARKESAPSAVETDSAAGGGGLGGVHLVSEAKSAKVLGEENSGDETVVTNSVDEAEHALVLVEGWFNLHFDRRGARTSVH